jgi:hypothetical protein
MKFWAWSFWTQGAERLANPVALVRVPDNSPPVVKERARRMLDTLSADQAAVIEQNTGIEFPNINYSSSSQVWENLITRCDAAMSKGILGSTLNVEVGDTGGAYNLGVSQGNLTIRPRLESDAKLLAGTIERDWFQPLLRYNAHLFNGMIPPTPRLRFIFDDPSQKQIPQHVFAALYESGGFTKNELRELAGMETIEGGDTYVLPAPKLPAPGFNRAEVAQVPLAMTPYRTNAKDRVTGRAVHSALTQAMDEELSMLGLYKTPSGQVERLKAPTSQTSSGSATSPLASALEALSEDPSS